MNARSSFIPDRAHRELQALVRHRRSLLVIIFHMLTRGTGNHDLGPNYFDQRSREVIVRRSVRRLENLGYRVTVEAAA